MERKIHASSWVIVRRMLWYELTCPGKYLFEWRFWWLFPTDHTNEQMKLLFGGILIHPSTQGMKSLIVKGLTISRNLDWNVSLLQRWFEIQRKCNQIIFYFISKSDHPPQMQIRINIKSKYYQINYHSSRFVGSLNNNYVEFNCAIQWEALNWQPLDCLRGAFGWPQTAAINSV